MDIPLKLVANFNRITKESDDMYIYKMNNKDINGQPSYVFKAPTVMAKHTLEMDISLPKWSIMENEAVYFNGMHKHVKGLKT